MSPTHDILLVTLGGTIESFYTPKFQGIGQADGTPEIVPLAKHAGDSVVPAALDRLGYADHYDHLALAMRDSKHNTTHELDAFMYTLVEHGYKKVVVVQGTDTMPVQARYVQRRLHEWGLEDCTVVFTGAMGPLRDAQQQWRDPEQDTYKNDGWHNLSAAMGDVAREPAGVYVRIAPGPHPHKADEIRKFVALGAPDANGVRSVVDSGFVADDPARHRDVRF